MEIKDRTIKLYDDAPYDREFTGKIIHVSEADGGCRVVLDRTLFFPEEGGQTSDRGNIDGFEVTHAAIEDGVITHTVSCDVSELAAGHKVRGVIDWGHRFSNMQNHTGEHILSGLLHSFWGSENVGFHLSDNIVTLDTSKELGAGDIKRLEKEANDVIYRNLPTECRYYAPSELVGMEYRSKIELKEDVRLVTIPGVDICACCAPHVAHTGEIGIIKVIKAVRYKGGMRLTFFAGSRAFDHLSELQDMTESISHILSESTDRLDAAVERLLNQNGEYKIKLKNEASKRLEDEIGGIPGKRRDVVLFTDALDNVVQRNAVNRLSAEHGGICAVFASDEDGGFNYILSHRDGDARDASKLLKEKLSARGGGSAEMVQGNVKAKKEEILKAFNIILQ
ncbi:MAG: hypothetical protein IJT24_01445 [Lachnospiraceae bacterium]|nr:hypothetical protein [Lachnospiraceae bacterium]